MAGILINHNKVVSTLWRIVYVIQVKGDFVAGWICIGSSISSATCILHQKVEGCTAGGIRIDAWLILKIGYSARIDRLIHRYRSTGQEQRTDRRHGDYLDRCKIIRIGIGKSKFRSAKAMHAIFINVESSICAGRCIVNRGNFQSNGIRYRVGV